MLDEVGGERRAGEKSPETFGASSVKSAGAEWSFVEIGAKVIVERPDRALRNKVRDDAIAFPEEFRGPTLGR